MPQWSVNQVGLVDLAVFIPGLGPSRPIVVVECDGYQFHKRSPEQASKDRKRMRILQRLGIPVYPFTGTDVVRTSEESAQEIVEFIDARVSGIERRWFQIGASILIGRSRMASASPCHILGREPGSIYPGFEMAVSQQNRERFQQIGRDRLALALASGTLQSIGITENNKPDAIEWVKEQDIKREAAQEIEISMQQKTLRWAKIAAWAGIAGVIVGILAIVATFVAR